MNNLPQKFLLAALAFSSVLSCDKKNYEKSETVAEPTSVHTKEASDSVSMAASQVIANKKFVKTAAVDMEVADVYEATVFIENQLKKLGGFVTESRLESHVLSQELFETSDKDAILVKKYKTENKLQIRVPTDKLADLLTYINDKKVFLNSRIIIAEDVTANSKIAELETKKLQITSEVIGKMKNNGEKVVKTDKNLEQINQQEIANINLADNLKYSTIDIYIVEPIERVAEIAVTNSKNIDNKYKFNFFFDAKNAFVEGYYLIQRLLVGFISIWPVLLIAIAIFYFMKRKKVSFSKNQTETNEP